MVKCLPEFEYFYCILEKIEILFLKLEDQKLQTMLLSRSKRPIQGGTSFVDRFYCVFVFAILSCLCHAALWSLAWKRLTFWLSCM